MKDNGGLDKGHNSKDRIVVEYGMCFEGEFIGLGGRLDVGMKKRRKSRIT